MSKTTPCTPMAKTTVLPGAAELVSATRLMLCGRTQVCPAGGRARALWRRGALGPALASVCRQMRHTPQRRDDHDRP